ncbi:hypothetical protein ACMFMF_006874 [Clarireedia jacksonii]
MPQVDFEQGTQIELQPMIQNATSTETRSVSGSHQLPRDPNIPFGIAPSNEEQAETELRSLNTNPASTQGQQHEPAAQLLQIEQPSSLSMQPIDNLYRRQSFGVILMSVMPDMRYSSMQPQPVSDSAMPISHPQGIRAS